MKKYSFAHVVAAVLGALIVVLAITFSTRAQDADLSFILKNGSKLNYDFNKGDAKFDLTMTIDATTPNIVYDWVANGTTVRKGHVTYSHESIATGRKISSDLTEGDDRSNSPILWFSLVQLRELRLGKTIYYKDNAKTPEGIVVTAKEKMSVNVNGTTRQLDVIHAKTVMSRSNDEFWILNMDDYPLVLKATVGTASFQIKEIKL